MGNCCVWREQCIDLVVDFQVNRLGCILTVKIRECDLELAWDVAVGQHFDEKLAIPISVAWVAMDNMVACWPYLVDTLVQATVPDRIDVAIEVEHIAGTCYIVPKVVRSMDLEANNSCLGFDHNFDTMIHKVNHMRLKLNSIVGVDVFLVHICPSDDIVILWENL